MCLQKENFMVHDKKDYICIIRYILVYTEVREGDNILYLHYDGKLISYRLKQNISLTVYVQNSSHSTDTSTVLLENRCHGYRLPTQLKSTYEYVHCYNITDFETL
jgi:hypothetical protein